HPVIRHALSAAVRAPIALAPSSRSTGFSVTTPAAESPRVWKAGVGDPAEGVARFESEPIECREFSRLRFELGGSPGAAGVRLVLRSARSGRETEVKGSFETRPGWTVATVPCPAGPFTVAAVDRSPGEGFAFTEPAEVARASAAAESLIH